MRIPLNTRLNFSKNCPELYSYLAMGSTLFLISYIIEHLTTIPLLNLHLPNVQHHQTTDARHPLKAHLKLSTIHISG